MIVRTPIIPGFSDTPAEITAILAFLRTLPRAVEYELLKMDREMSCLTNSIMREVKPWRCLQYNVLYFLLYVRAREHDL